MLSRSGWCLANMGQFQEAGCKRAVLRLKHKRGGGFQVAVLRLQIWVVAVAGLDSL